MAQKYVSGDKSRSVESLRHLRLMALLKELEKVEGRMEAAAMLGVNYKTLAKAIDTGELSRRMSHALERLLLSLLSITQAAVYHDDLGLGELQDKFRYYPRDV